ncbi:Nicotinate dehydrogenase subunit B [bacterium HR11]|nr:Nicotinate dehydrogenase subunit B [bacterium HR11]
MSWIKKLNFTPMFVLMAASLAMAVLGWVGLTRGIPSPDSTAQVARGRYLVTISHCNDCHTPWKMEPQGPAPDETRLLSGHPEDLKMPVPPRVDAPWGWYGAVTNTAFAGPWGTSYGANLTPDPDTGLGAWTEAIFIKAMRTGRHMGAGRPIMPPMPWQNVGRMTDADLKAIFAYLRTIPPIRNRVPDYEPPAGIGE